MDSARVIDLLVLARALVEAGWTRGDWAVDQRGERAGLHDEGAVRFCVAGALRRAGWELALPQQVEILARRVLSDALESDRLADFNDNPATTQADVLALFDAACERAGKG